MATLTGAARVALGPELPALLPPMKHRAELVESLQKARSALAHAAMDGYEDELSSKIAD